MRVIESGDKYLVIEDGKILGEFETNRDAWRFFRYQKRRITEQTASNVRLVFYKGIPRTMTALNARYMEKQK